MKRLFRIKSPIVDGINIEQWRLSICATCSVNDGGICSKQRGGCACPVGSKVKCKECKCPLNKW